MLFLVFCLGGLVFQIFCDVMHRNPSREATISPQGKPEDVSSLTRNLVEIQDALSLERGEALSIITPPKIMYNVPPEKVAVQQEDGLSSSPSIFQEICFRGRLLTFILPCLGRQLSFQFKGPE